jgi:5S rRNA maturation endonuclease (ribonuclease M5)
MSTLLDVIPNVEKSGTDSWHAPHCPNCGQGDDRLVIWPYSGETGHVWCRKCDWGRSTHPDGPIDGIEYLRVVRDMSFQEACEFFGVESRISDTSHARPSARSGCLSAESHVGQNQTRKRNEGSRWSEYSPPSRAWRASAYKFVKECKERLQSGSKSAQSALGYLRKRGFTDRTIYIAGLGVNPRNRFPKRTEWGLAPREDRTDGGKIWLPRGVVIPWFDSTGLSNINIRRPNGDIDPDADKKWLRRKYQQAAGSSAPLWGVQWFRDDLPAVIVEGEFDALAIRQVAADLCVPFATGSTGGARRRDWVDLLSEAPTVLVSFDSDEAGQQAALAWTATLPNAQRWYPHHEDPSEMLKSGDDLRLWVRRGLHAASISHSSF